MSGLVRIYDRTTGRTLAVRAVAEGEVLPVEASEEVEVLSPRVEVPFPVTPIPALCPTTDDAGDPCALAAGHSGDHRDQNGLWLGTQPSSAEDEGPGQSAAEQPAADPEPELWIVFRDPLSVEPSWRNTISRTYGDQMTARTEAERLCREHGGRFVVMRAVAYVEGRGHWNDGAPPVEGFPF